MKKCNHCDIVLIPKNWPEWRKKRRSYVCIDCSRKIYKMIYAASKAIRLERERLKRRANKQIIINEYGGKCSCCGEKHFEFLTIAHKNNDGAKHRKDIGGSRRMAEWVIKNNFPIDWKVIDQFS